jgi:ribosomal protein S18 acetylase RimI-like enzyme
MTTSALQFEILDLRHYSAAHLRPVLEQESLVWNERLHWDFHPSAELMLQYLDSHVLPGYVAVDKGEVSAYVFCVYEENKAVIGDVFARPARQSPEEEPPAIEVENRLLEFVIELLQNSPGIERIESQLLLHPHGSHQPVFDRHGFTTYPRLFMELDLRPNQNPSGPTNPGAPSLTTALPSTRVGAAAAAIPNQPPLPKGLELHPWQESDLTAAGRLISSAYEHHLDSEINDQYRTVAGSLRFLHNIVRYPGCGAFDPAASCIITGPSREPMVGMLLCSRIRPDTGHVTQICVAPTKRGHGLASHMLDACAANLRARGLAALTLTVTAGNTSAVSLYRSHGYKQKHAFDAMVWQRPNRRFR